MELRLITVPKGSDVRVLVFALGGLAANPGREVEVVTNGLEEGLPAVVYGITEFAERNGSHVVGPRAESIASWFNGLNWRFVSAAPG